MPNNQIKVILFSGGRGTASISQALLKHPQVELCLIVNAYDDGLSTGRLREFVKGMLGPSDIRKNIFHLMVGDQEKTKSLKAVLEYRLPAKTSYSLGKKILNGLLNYDFSHLPQSIQPEFAKLNYKQLENVNLYSKTFLKHIKTQKGKKQIFDFGDCAIGNILFAGCYLHYHKDFNHTIKEFSRFSEIPSQVLNVTDGQDLILMGLKKNGQLLVRESEIVEKQSDIPIQDIYLRKNYLSKTEMTKLKSSSIEVKTIILGRSSVIPAINPEVKKALKSADIIVYGPGTQHSSLFPSYLTKGLGEAIKANRVAKKIFISNIHKDHEIKSETASSLLNKFLYYLSRKNQITLGYPEVLTHAFFQTMEGVPKVSEHSRYLKIDKSTLPFSNEEIEVEMSNWEVDAGKHSGGYILERLISIANSQLQKKVKSFAHQVSIIVPALNEEKTIEKVIRDLTLLDFAKLGLGREIIVIDGGSSDNTFSLATKTSEVQGYQLAKNLGRGAAFRLGIEKARGDIIAFFPSDNEYASTDLLKVIAPLLDEDFKAVFGSRLIKCTNISKQLKEIYKGNYILYLLSKYGGMAMSILNLVLFNRFISDFFTGIKAFDSTLLKALDLKSNSTDFESEVLAKLGKRGVFILEVPVEFRPRTRKEGKKMTVFAGLKAMFSLIRYRFTK